LLAGRKLLLADDSVTIQKVIDLTFADEGVRVVAFNNGQDAIDHVEQEAPDIVLADVFMPLKNGFEVCEYIKRNEKLKHIPVMLLVGSFEPFDEGEARRVGADDILTKPFQSIRRLIDRVGALVGKPPTEPEVITAQLPKPAESEPEEMLSAKEIEIVTADTRPLLDADIDSVRMKPALESESLEGERTMEIAPSEVVEQASLESEDVLLDLDDLEPRSAPITDDFVLDLDMEDTLGGNVGTATAPAMRDFVEPAVTETAPAAEFAYAGAAVRDEVAASFVTAHEEVAYEDQVHEVLPQRYATLDTVEPSSVAVTAPEATVPAPVAITPDSLSPEMIDAIARRAVEMLSERVVREIAWEVVPDLAELLIKRRLEEQESQPK
jgi:CheY-like chemotaxis protein